MTELIPQVTNTKFWYGIPAFAFDHHCSGIQRNKFKEGEILMEVSSFQLELGGLERGL
jgi:hypothetical protein